ncbi:MAG: N-acetylmuramate alpha-1-phosphate uridylyltransferase MurU [Oceanococcus sp.]
MKAMLLAAGRGERLRPLTDSCPKPLIEVAGKPLIEHALDRLEEAGVTDCVINLNWLGDKIQSHLQANWRWDIGVHFSHEQGQRLETGGGIFKVLKHFGEQAFFVLNADVYCDFDFQSLRQRVEAWPAGATTHLLMVDNPAHNPDGDFALCPNGQLALQGKRLTYAGIGLLQRALFAGQEPGRFALAPLLREAIHQQTATGQYHQGMWTDVGTPERLELLRAQLA